MLYSSKSDVTKKSVSDEENFFEKGCINIKTFRSPTEKEIFFKQIFPALRGLKYPKLLLCLESAKIIKGQMP